MYNNSINMNITQYLHIHSNAVISGHLTFFAPAEKIQIALTKLNFVNKSKALLKLCK